MPLKNMLTDKDAEKNGVQFVYDEDTRLTIARAGGSNSDFFRVLNRLRKPYRRAIDAGVITEHKARALMQAVYIEAVIKKWETRRSIDGKLVWLVGIDGSWGADSSLMDEHGILKPTVENMQATFDCVPDLWEDLEIEARKMATFRREELETEAKNS